MTYERPKEWTFTSSVEHPDGLRAEVVVTIPAPNASPDVRELGEIGQMAANSVFGHYERSVARRHEERASA
jgi:hypothetical protein